MLDRAPASSAAAVDPVDGECVDPRGEAGEAVAPAAMKGNEPPAISATRTHVIPIDRHEP